MLGLDQRLFALLRNEDLRGCMVLGTAAASLYVSRAVDRQPTLHDVLEADRKPDGALRQDNVFRYVLAGKPA